MAGGKKNTDEDDEDFMDMDDDMIDGDEDEIDDELALPDVLADISYKEKKELFAFKKSHTGVEWEEEVLRRTDLLTRKIDMERLQRMAMGTGESSATAAAVAKRGGKPLRGKAATKAAPGRKRKIEDEDEDGEEDDDDDEPQPQQRRRSNRAAAVTSRSKKSRSKVEQSDGEDEEEEEDDDDEGRVSEEGSDDDLFDSDEEKEMSTRFKTDGTTALDDDEDEEEPEDRPQGRGRLKKASKGRGYLLLYPCSPIFGTLLMIVYSNPHSSSDLDDIIRRGQSKKRKSYQEKGHKNCSSQVGGRRR